MKEWYIYQGDGNHVGPVTSEALARGIAGGKVPRDAHFGAVGDPAWVQVTSVPEIAQAIRALETQGFGPASARPMSSVPPAPPPPPHSSPSVQEVGRAAAALSASAPKADPQPAAQAAEKKADEKKPEEKKAPPLPEHYKKMPLMIFGGFFALAVLLVVLAVIIKPGVNDFERASSSPPAANGAAK